VLFRKGFYVFFPWRPLGMTSSKLSKGVKIFIRKIVHPYTTYKVYLGTLRKTWPISPYPEIKK
jgi:hypothetical protein